MSQLDPFDRILASLHEAALDDAHWPAAAARIDEACGAKANGLIVGKGFGADAEVSFARFYFRGQRRQDVERQYFEVYHPIDERLPRLRQLPDSHLARVADLYSDEELKTSPVYNEGLPRIDSQNGLNARLDGPHGSRIVWAFADPIAAGGWQPAQIELIRRLLPHVRQFVRVRQVLGSAQALGASLSDLLDNRRVAVIHLDRGGRIVEANDRARALLRRGDGLFDQAGCLRARLPADDDRLQGLLARALPRWGGRAPASVSLTVQRPWRPSRLVLHVSPVGVDQTDLGFGDVGVLVLVVEPDSGSTLDARLVTESLGLTASEGQVATLLAAGNSVGDIALMTGRQANTIRFHLKRIYRKRGLTHQAELVRLVLSLEAVSQTRH